MAENLRERGVFVTIVEALDQVMNVIDFEMAPSFISTSRPREWNSTCMTPFQPLQRMAKGSSPSCARVRTSRGHGDSFHRVKPETSLARASGLALDGRGYIVTDAHMRTSDPSIYAVGDAVVVKNPITGKSSAVPLAGPANKQARIAADNIAGAITSEYRGAIGTAIAKVST